MMTVLFVFIAIAFGLLLFSSLQDKIPDELSFLRASPTVSSLGAVAPGAKVTQYKGWQVSQIGTTIEALKAFNGPLTANGGTYTAPIIGILCNNNSLDVRVESTEPTTGSKGSSVIVAGAPEQTWARGVGTNLFPPDPSALLRTLITAPRGVTLTLSYRNLGAQSSLLDTTGLSELVERFPANCRP